MAYWAQDFQPRRIVLLFPDESSDDKLRRADRILAALAPLYPAPLPALDFGSPFQLLVATVLSAQCTDAMVNTVTPALFARWPGPAELAAAAPAELEAAIHSTGFFRAKARHLVGLSAALVRNHGGEVPLSWEALTALPGVGRKTAGVVLSVFADEPAIIVDTHFGRVSRRLGFTAETDPGKVERDVARALPADRWTLFSHRLNMHGRATCVARKPRCSACAIRDDCPSRETDP